MTENREIIVNDDLLDEELMNMPGLRISEDPVQKPAAKPAQKQNVKPTTHECKPDAQPKPKYVKGTEPMKISPKDKPKAIEAEYEQITPSNNFRFGDGLERVKECAKSTVFFGGMSLLFFYWQQTGQMVHSAAFPSIVICTLLAGISIGKIIGKHTK